MHVDDGVAPVQLLPHRLEIRVARPPSFVVVGVDADGVDFQRVVGVFDFFQRALEVGQRHAAHQPELLGCCCISLAP